jgi:hypothetical protein
VGDLDLDGLTLVWNRMTSVLPVVGCDPVRQEPEPESTSLGRLSSQSEGTERERRPVVVLPTALDELAGHEDPHPDYNRLRATRSVLSTARTQNQMQRNDAGYDAFCSAGTFYASGGAKPVSRPNSRGMNLLLLAPSEPRTEEDSTRNEPDRCKNPRPRARR